MASSSLAPSTPTSSRDRAAEALGAIKVPTCVAPLLGRAKERRSPGLWRNYQTQWATSLTPELLRRQRRAFSHGLELGPHDGRVDLRFRGGQ